MPAETRICLPWMITFMGSNLRSYSDRCILPH
jgi:hypothetical protein